MVTLSLLTNIHIRLTVTLLVFFLLRRCGLTWDKASSFLRFLDNTQRRTTFGRTFLDERSARRRDVYLTTHNTQETDIQTDITLNDNVLNSRCTYRRHFGRIQTLICFFLSLLYLPSHYFSYLVLTQSILFLYPELLSCSSSSLYSYVVYLFLPLIFFLPLHVLYCFCFLICRLYNILSVITS
jgi:hypothetical protein